MIQAAVLSTFLVAAVVAALWGFEYGERVGDERGLIGWALCLACVVAGVLWAFAV